MRQTKSIQHDFEADHLSDISEKSSETSVPDSTAESIESKGEEEQQKKRNIDIPAQPSVSSESKTVVMGNLLPTGSQASTEVSPEQVETVTPVVNRQTGDGSVSYHAIELPDGKLGLVVEHLDDGHIVAKVKPGSQMAGLIMEGDVIVGLDEVDTRSMSGAALTSLMARKSATKRILKIARGDRASSKDAIGDGLEAPSTGRAVGTRGLVPSSASHTETEGEGLDETTAAPQSAPTSDDDESSDILSVLDTDDTTLPSTTSTDEASAVVDDSAKKALADRDVEAPPGKLGIVVGSSEAGPVIAVVKEGSPMLGLITEGEIIAAVNGTDTRSMSASTVSSLLARSWNKTRILTLTSNNKGPSADEMVEEDEASQTPSDVAVTDLGTVMNIKAPPGKLGIIVDTSTSNPVVGCVIPGSALEGVMFPGDVILKINAFDTTGMSVSSFTAVISMSKEMTRELVIRRPPPQQE